MIHANAFQKNPVLILSVLQSIAGFHLVYLYMKQNKQYKKLHNITTYLVDVMEKNDISLTQFDVIALQSLGVTINVIEEI